MYTAYVLTEKSRKVLHLLYPAKYPEFIGHHITEHFGVPADTPAPDEPVLVQVVGYIDTGDGLEGFVVEIDGDSKRESDGGTYHITWSLDRDKGYKPFNTNQHVNEATPVKPITIDVTSEVLK